MKFTFQRQLITLIVCIAQLFIVIACSVDRSEENIYTAASSSYGILAEKSLDLMAGFDLETWGTMLSDSVVYYFPDGDEKTCTRLTGKPAFLAWWKNYIAASGIKSMSIQNASYLPVYVKDEVRPGDLSGTHVIAYFSNKMIYESGAVSVKMSFIIHFDKNKLIDGYYTYYDMTQIIKMQKDKRVFEEFAMKQISIEDPHFNKLYLL